MWNPSNREPFPHPALALGYQKPRSLGSALEHLEHSVQLLADIIADDGQQYWPIFARLEQEVEKRKAQDRVLKRALALSERKRDSKRATESLWNKMAYGLAYKFNSSCQKSW